MGEIAYGRRRGATRYLAGLTRRAWDWNLRGPERLSGPDRPSELRDEIFFREGAEVSLDLKTETELSQGATLRLNLKARTRDDDESEVSDRSIEGGGSELFLRASSSATDELELGGDFERDLSPATALKLIALFRRTREDGGSGLEISRRDGGVESSRSPRSSDSGEGIGRVELDWSGWSGHTLKTGVEFVHNFVDSASELIVDDGAGPVVVDVPGSDTRVVERRVEAFATDSWRVSEKLTVDLGFGYEFSEIEQSGDIANSRSFTYPKPSIALTYAQSAKVQWRFRLDRQVSQLDFFDFVSSSNFEDLDLDFGNPDLRPERTWHLTSTGEWRFGEIGVVEIELFYDRIDDVEDLLPVGEGFEIVGNIGDGERWGGSIDMTVPLGFLGLGDSRADVSYRLQDSSVTDPVTGLFRGLSGESDQELEVSLRKELPKRHIAIGTDYNWSSPQNAFGFDELVFETQRSHLNVHLEAKLRKGTKLRFEVFNLIDDPRRRRRTVFEDTRRTGLVAFREDRGWVDGQWFRLTLSGLF
jgi:outer membrane receptor protein involved in Fe transport